MKIEGKQHIAAGRAAVYAALNDAEILRACIPGCVALRKEGETRFAAEITLKIGPIKANFKGEVELSDLQPPQGYTIAGQGAGGAAGFAKGRAQVRLEEAEDGGTNLLYTAEAQVGGKIAQLGGRLIDATAKKLAAQFFAALAGHFAPADSTAPANNAAVATAADKPKLSRRTLIAAAVTGTLLVAALLSAVL